MLNATWLHLSAAFVQTYSITYYELILCAAADHVSAVWPVVYTGVNVDVQQINDCRPTRAAAVYSLTVI